MTRSATPILLGPIDPIQKSFDTSIYNGEYVYLRGDNSVGTGKLDKTTGIPLTLINGKQQSIFAHGPNTLWEDGEPRIHYPLPYTVRTKHYDTFLSTLRWPFMIIASALLIYLSYRWNRAPTDKNHP